MKRLTLALLLLPSFLFASNSKITGQYDEGDTVAINRNFRDLQSSLSITKLQSQFRIKVGTFTSPTGPGNFSVSGVGFRPRAVVLGIGISLGANESVVALGAGTADNSVSIFGEYIEPAGGDGLDTTTAALFRYPNNAGAVRASCTLVSMDIDGFTVNYSSADVSGRTTAYLAFQ